MRTVSPELGRRMRRLGWALLIFPPWTVSIKFVLPVLVALREGVPLATHVMWDFWWVPHLLLGFLLVRGDGRALAVGVAVTVPEVLIITVKLAIHMNNPDWSFFRFHWFVNKVVLLVYFVWLAAFLASAPARRALAGRL